MLSSKKYALEWQHGQHTFSTQYGVAGQFPTQGRSLWCHTSEAPTPSPKIISVWGAKNEPKTSPMYLLILIMTIFPFLLCWWKRYRYRISKACNRGASRLGEAWPRPRLGRKTYWHKDKARLTVARDCIILLLKSQQGWTWSSWQLCCLTRILGRSWRKGGRAHPLGRREAWRGGLRRGA